MNSSAKYTWTHCFWVFTIAVVAFAALAAHGVGNNTTTQPAFAALSSAPLCFEAGAGQPDGTQFIARGTRCSVLIAPDAAEIFVGKASDQIIPLQQTSARAVRLQLVGANLSAKMSGRDRMTATANYFVGNDPAKWKTGIPLFSRVQVDDVYPGVQVVYYASQSAELEYDFLLQPGARPAQIQFRVEGADDVQVDAAGNLVLKIDGQEIRQHQPVVYQDVNGTRRLIDGSYHLNENGTVGFVLGEYDHNLPLVIDPVLEFLTYIGGRNFSEAWGIVLQTNNIPAIYVAGQTLSKNLLTPVSSTNMLTTNAIVFPVAFTNKLFPNGAVTNRVFTNYQGGTGAFGDAFVAGYSTNGSLNFLTYLGGRRNDLAFAIAADPADGVWLTGFTDSPNFPIVNGELSNDVLFSTLTGPTNNALGIAPVDAFVTHLSGDGSTLLFSTYFGGDEIDEGTGITLDSSGDVFLTGLTSSTNLPGLPGPGNLPAFPNIFQPTNSGFFDAFVAELSPDTTLNTNLTSTFTNNYTNTFTTFFGATNVDYALSIALDSSNDTWITGLTYSTNFLTTNLFFLTNTFLAQMSNGTANSIDIESNHLFSDLNSQTNSPHHNTSARSDAFVAEFSPFGTNLLFSTLLGGTNDDVGVHIAVNPANNNVYVTGYTLSRDFPTNVATGLTFTDAVSELNVTSDFPHITTNIFIGAATNFISHAFVTELVPTNYLGTNSYFIGSSTSLGGNFSDRGTGIQLDAAGNVYVVGSAGSTNFFHTNVVILTNNVPGTNVIILTNDEVAVILNTNRHGIITNYYGMGILTNNFTYVNLTRTNSTGKLHPNSNNTNDVFIAVLTPDLSNYRWSILLGGPGDNEATGIAVDPSGSAVYFVGSTTSRTNFATTNNVVQPVYSRGARQDAFAGKISGLQPPPGGP